jgi:hypothetical protein
MKFDYAAASLRDNFFKVSGPLDFNDPFECRGLYLHFDEALRKYVHQNFERLRFEYIRRTNSTTPELQARFTEEFLFKTYFDSASRSLDSSWINAVNETVLMMCFVKERGLKDASDVLFWSHYADSGKGIRIVFDLPESPQGGIYYMKEVEYCEKVLAFDCRKMDAWLQGKEFQDYLERISHLKGMPWEYENEIRMIIPRRIPEQMKRLTFTHLCPREKDGVIHYFVRIGYDAIRRIDFGPRVDLKQVVRLVEDLKHKKGTGHIAFWQATLGPGAYTYIYQKVS